MPKKSSVVIGKFVRKVAKLRGGGSALPGLVIEKIDRDFAKDCLDQPPQGVVVISGTNGKTTTTKIVVELLEDQGLKVFTNNTGSNFVRGVIAALLENIDIHGRLDADIAVLELDEAHAVKFTELIKPRHSLLLNVMRDQLDRFGEIDHTAQLLQEVAKSTTENVVINRDDPRISGAEFIASLPNEPIGFGVSSELAKLFPSDDDLLGNSHRTLDKKAELNANDTSLKSINGEKAVITYDGIDHEVTLRVNGVYNALNAVAAVALVRSILGAKLDDKKMLETLAGVKPAFGRGEELTVNGQPVELLLVKNPSGFQLALDSFNDKDHDVMIAINDNYADGRDMSWLWNVDFSKLKSVTMVSGIRAADMALRLKYDEVALHVVVEPNLSVATQNFVQNSDRPKRIFTTYTAMLEIRKMLSGRRIL